MIVAKLKIRDKEVPLTPAFSVGVYHGTDGLAASLYLHGHRLTVPWSLEMSCDETPNSESAGSSGDEAIYKFLNAIANDIPADKALHDLRYDLGFPWVS